LGRPPGDHVGVADGLDLLQPVAPGELIEGREQLVEGCHHLRWADPLAAAGEVHQVGKQLREGPISGAVDGGKGR
jgi:hypothetical protein